MSKNLIPEIAKLLGVEIGEKFMANDRGVNVLCGIYEDGLCKLNHDGSKRPGFGDDLLGKILRGKSEIVKLPWEPKKHDLFYYPFVVESRVACSFWEDYNTFHLTLKALGMVYRTQEEAEAHMAEDYMKLTGKKLEG